MNKVLIHSKKSTNKVYVLIFNRQVSMFSFNAEDAGRRGAKHGIYAVPRARGAVYGGFAPLHLNPSVISVIIDVLVYIKPDTVYNDRFLVDPLYFSTCTAVK